MSEKLNTKCIEQVSRDNGWRFGQCSRKRGHGRHGLYCKQHDPERKAAKRKEECDKYDAEMSRRHDEHKRHCILLELAEGIPTKELKNFKLMYKPELGTLLDSGAYIMRVFGKLIFDNWPVNVPGKDEALDKVVDHRIRIQEVLKEIK